MEQGRTPARGASIRFVPQEDEDPFVEPSKSQAGIATSSNAFLAPHPGLIASQAGQESFRFGFTSPAAQSPPSPVVGESALSPPEPSTSRWSSSTILSPGRARISSSAVPWYPPNELAASGISTDTGSPEISGGLLQPPATTQTSRFSASSSSDSPPAASFFSPTVDGGSSPETPRSLPFSKSRFSSTTVESPPPLPIRPDVSDSAPRSPSTPSPSQWQRFFSPAQPQYSHFSASTMSPPPEASPQSPPSTADSADSTSSSSSMDGTAPSALPELPAAAFYNQPNKRIYSSSSGRYSHPFPTTDLSVIDEDDAYQEEIYPSSPPSMPPPIPTRSPSRAVSRGRDTPSPDSARGYGAYHAGTAAAVAYAAGSLSPPRPVRHVSLPPVPSRTSSMASRRRSGRHFSAAPQLPPLPPFNHSTESLQRFFQYFPTPDPNASPVIDTNGQPRSPGPSIVTFGSVTGPNGERFSALREKRKSRGVYWPDGTPKKRRPWVRGMSWKLWLVVAIIAFLLMTILAIGLGIGLSRNNNGNGAQGQNDGNQGGDGNGAGAGVDDQTPVFPAGTYSITTNLFNVSAACTNVSSTWSCAPGQTLQSNGLNASQVGLSWTVTQNNITDDAEDDDGFSISSLTNPFGLQFNSTPLTLREQGTQNEHWGFETRVSKRVRPVGDVAGNNAAVECNYPQADLTGRLFTQRQPDAAFADGPSSWPGAVEVEESSEVEGECFEVRNGVRGARVAVGVGPGFCTCSYGDSDPGYRVIWLVERLANQARGVDTSL